MTSVVWVPVVDISRNQTSADFVKMRAAGVQGVILRASHGQTVDDHFAGFYQAARAAGFEDRDLAVYTFINPKRGTGAQCAVATLDAVQAVFGHTSVGYMLDIEAYAGQSPNPGLAPVFGPSFAAHLREHLETVRLEAPDARPFGYSNLSFWNGPVPGQPGKVWVGDAQLAAELEWLVARYPDYSDAQYARTGYPPAPAGWADWAFKVAPDGPFPPAGATGWVGWQFSAGFNDQGATYGVGSLHLDLNIVHPAAWARWTGRVAPVPPVPGDDDMHIRFLAPKGSPVRLFAACTASGVALRGEWSGPGDDPKVAARIAAHRAAGMTDLECELVDLLNVSLDGPVPPGMSAGQFANTAEIVKRETPAPAVVEDTEARVRIDAVNGRLAKVQQFLGQAASS